MFRASSKDTDKLSALLPFKSLTLSGLKDKRGVFAMFNRLLIEAKLGHYNFHALRHTFAT